MGFPLPPTKFKRWTLMVEAFNQEDLPWDEFRQRCLDAGYTIIEERPATKCLLIGQHEGDLEQADG